MLYIAPYFCLNYNPTMSERHIARLEEQLERLVEGAFTSLFGKAITARDLALELARAMEGGLQESQDIDTRPIAPDDYTILLNSSVVQGLQKKQPDIADYLSQHLIEFATQSGYRLINAPTVQLQTNLAFSAKKIHIAAKHQQHLENSTAVMKPVHSPAQAMPINPQLIINGEKTIPLESTLVTIGRSDENEVILEDPFASRYHCQLRLRFGYYMLFDIQSTGGTYVNGIPVREYRLQAGDVIRIGDTQLIYLEDENPNRPAAGTTDTLNPVEF